MGLRDVYRRPVPYSVWIGFDPREVAAFDVARRSIARTSPLIRANGLVLDRLRSAGLYWRPTERRINPDTGAPQLWDTISDAPMATEFSISRFLVPHLARGGLALFMDCDMLIRADLRTLFETVQRSMPDKAVICVKHRHEPASGVKMDGQMQTAYARKNWSSFVIFNCDHPANQALTLGLINEAPGRDLHRFCWIDNDNLIGELPVEWNWLVGHSDPEIVPKNVHFTDGIPLMEGYADVAFADEFMATLHDHAERGG